jgi:hypothetical protein
MTAIVAEGTGRRPPDLWNDLPRTVARAGGDPAALWIDDSKRIYRAGQGLDRLETASLAAVVACGNKLPGCYAGLLDAVGAGTTDDVELTPWLGDAPAPELPRPGSRELTERTLALEPLAGASWRIVSVRSVVVGPARFNDGLSASGSKAKVHFAAFARLLKEIWELSADGTPASIRADKHGGRHFYLQPLYDAFPDSWIDRGAEGPEHSRYTVREGSRRMTLTLQPRADSDDGLVALASIVSKWIREVWMGVFNDHWTARIPGLRPSAGYPGDSARFREAIEPDCRAQALEPSMWWREK